MSKNDLCKRGVESSIRNEYVAGCSNNLFSNPKVFATGVFFSGVNP
jgi:hypothetical protein